MGVLGNRLAGGSVALPLVLKFNEALLLPLPKLVVTPAPPRRRPGIFIRFPLIHHLASYSNQATIFYMQGKAGRRLD